MRIIILFAVCLMFFSSAPVRVFSEEEEIPFSYEDHNKRDPLWPLVNAGGSVVNYDNDLSVSDLNLEGIMSSGKQEKVALINGKVVKVNDKVGLYTVVEISSNSVVLTRDGQTFNLILKKEE
jgi:hypothetical protein